LALSPKGKIFLARGKNEVGPHKYNIRELSSIHRKTKEWRPLKASLRGPNKW